MSLSLRFTLRFSTYIFLAAIFLAALFATLNPAAAMPPHIVSPPPYETASTDSSISLFWESSADGHSLVRYGRTTDFEKGLIAVENQGSTHEVTLNGLSPAQIYHLKVGVASGTDTTWSSPQIVSSGSPDEATQQINTYFNGSVSAGAAWLEGARGGFDLGGHYADRIRNARHSVDITFFNISGDTGEEIKTALVRAARFGAEIRIIMHHDLGSPADNIRQDLLLAADDHDLDLEIIQSDIGKNVNRDGLMHNKIAIIDYKSDDPADTWLITSSWNSTDHGSDLQYQNMIEFQDPALAGGYRAEFNQMWGSDQLEPNASGSRFSARKRVVNPTRFWVDGVEVDIYFSPQSNTQQHIIDRLHEAQNDIALPLYLVTQWPYRDALQDLTDDGKSVRGAIGDISYNHSLFNSLAGFADVHDHGANSNILLHHKTGIIDGFAPGSGSGQVITGSMNWSRAGNETNDENTIIIRDDHIANLYFQEFAARYYEAGGESDLTVTSAEGPLGSELPESVVLQQNYPNPFNPSTQIRFDLPESDLVSLHIYDVTGRRVATLLDQVRKSSGSHQVRFEAGDLSSGLYLYVLSLDSGRNLARSMMFIK